MNITDRKAT